jgi:hypothetical protein
LVSSTISTFRCCSRTETRAADYDPSAPIEPYLLPSRQFEDDDGGVCHLETHDIDRFAGHYRLRLIEFTPTRLVLEIDRREDRTVEVMYKLSIRRFREVRRIVHVIFGVETMRAGVP